MAWATAEASGSLELSPRGTGSSDSEGTSRGRNQEEGPGCYRAPRRRSLRRLEFSRCSLLVVVVAVAAAVDVDGGDDAVDVLLLRLPLLPRRCTWTRERCPLSQTPSETGGLRIAGDSSLKMRKREEARLGRRGFN